MNRWTINKWKFQAIDIKTAFPQGKQIEIMVYLQPLKEVNTSNTNKIWKLRKYMYGLAETGRYWYLYVKEELIKLGANEHWKEHYWKEHCKLVSILACHVDDMIWGSNDNFKITVIDNLNNTWAYNWYKMMILV